MSTTAAELRPFIVHCGSCRHEWAPISLPMSVAEFGAALTDLSCPSCSHKKIYCGDAPTTPPKATP